MILFIIEVVYAHEQTHVLKFVFLMTFRQTSSLLDGLAIQKIEKKYTIVVKLVKNKVNKMKVISYWISNSS